MKTKVLISIFALAYLSSCSLFWTDAPELPVEEPCPVVIIPRDIAYVTQKVNWFDIDVNWFYDNSVQKSG